MDSAIIGHIAKEVSLPESSVAATVDLIEKGATVPFIVRYRKEVTSGMGEQEVYAIQEQVNLHRELNGRRPSLLRLLEERGKLTEELRRKIETCHNVFELDGIYHLFKARRRTRAGEAVDKGLEPLAEYIWNQDPDAWSLEEHADVFIDPEKRVATREEALQGAADIVAEWIAEHWEYRATLRDMLWKDGMVVSTVVPAKAGQKTKYNMYYDHREPVATIPSHRILAIRRGSKEGILTSSIQGDNAKALQFILTSVIRDSGSVFAPVLEAAARDSYARIIRPMIETEVRAQLKARADKEAIRVFRENLKNLLLSPPAGPMVVIGLDPARGNERRLAVVDRDGNLVEEAALVLKSAKASKAAKAQKESLKEQAAEPAAPGQSVGDGAAEQVAQPIEEAPAAGEEAQPEPEAEQQRGETSAEAPGENKAEQQPEPGDAAGAEHTSAETATQPEAAEESRRAPQSEEASDEAEAAVSSAAVPTPEQEALQATLSDTTVLESSFVQPAGDSAEAAKAEAAESEEGETSISPLEKEADVEPPEMPSETEESTEARIEEARTVLRDLISKHNVQAIALGSSTSSRETEVLLRRILSDDRIEGVLIATVNDAGVTVYSSSRVAREELPDLSNATRCAVSMARRLQDPLSELIKVDPKLIGVGQYQHDVDQKELHRCLVQTVQSCVNSVGVDLNAAGFATLRYVSGLSDRLARKIVTHRDANGSFPSRESLRAMPGMTENAYQQAAGFLRIHNGENPLDGTTIHPEAYAVVEKIAESAGVALSQVLGNKELLSSVNWEEVCSSSNAGVLTLNDIREELLRPGRDPRRTFKVPKFRPDIRDISDLQEGLKLEGIVTNVTNFGAFVDIGIQQDGLVHLSQMSNRFIRDPREAVKVGDVVEVKVISVESDTKRIGLSIKALLPTLPRRRKKPRPRNQQAGAAPAAGASSAQSNSADRRSRRGREGSRRPRPPRKNNPAAPKAPEDPNPEEEPDQPQASLQEKIAILQSKFRGIS